MPQDSEVFKILFLEDNEVDVELMQDELRSSSVNFESKVHYLKKDFIKTVSDYNPDIILADYSLPSFDGMKAFRMLKEGHFYIPFVLVTGVLSEQLALECLKEGVDDFILKSSFKRLPVAINNAIRKKQIEREKARMAYELHKSHEELKSFLNKQQIAIEEERRYIARDLHDELGQMLTALKIDVTMLKKKVVGKKAPLEAVSDEFDEVLSMVGTLTRSVQRISSGLRPEILDELGVIEAIKWMVKEFIRRNQIKCELELDESIEVDGNFAITLYRIIQEAMTNVARHAQATWVRVVLMKASDQIFIEITDNGRGIKIQEVEDSTSLGIIGLRERVTSLKGRFEIDGSSGTRVSATIPLPKNKKIEA